VNKPASDQLSAFAYDVKKTPDSKLISSACISQISTIDAVGPDIFTRFPFGCPM
jgi:hypothetical protein